MFFKEKTEEKIVNALVETIWHIFEVIITVQCNFQLPGFTCMQVSMNLHISCEV